jgi:hypothetical protein
MYNSWVLDQVIVLSAASLVINDVVTCMDKRQHCAALFIDLSKASDNVDHSLLIQRLSSIRLDHAACNWFKNYLTDRTQCVSTYGVKLGFLDITKGVPQGSILGPHILGQQNFSLLPSRPIPFPEIQWSLKW